MDDLKIQDGRFGTLNQIIDVLVTKNEAELIRNPGVLTFFTETELQRIRDALEMRSAEKQRDLVVRCINRALRWNESEKWRPGYVRDVA